MEETSSSGENRRRRRKKSNEDTNCCSGSTISQKKLYVEQSESLDTIIVNCEAMEKALGIHLVLKTILKQLDSLDLLTCRLVCSTWFDLSNKILHNRDDVHISLRYFKESQSYVLNRVQRFTLPQLNDLLQKSKVTYTLNPSSKLKGLSSFPCQNFAFSRASLFDASLQEFFELYGNQLKSLSLDLHKGDSSDITSLRHILLVQAPNLRHLQVKSWPKNEEHIPLLPIENNVDDSSSSSLATTTTQSRKRPRLPHLLSFDTGDFGYFLCLNSDWCRETLETILKEAPNLLNIIFPGSTLKYIEILESQKKLSLLRGLRIRPNTEKLNILEKFSSCRPALHFLGFDEGTLANKMDLKRYSGIMCTILESSQMSLDTIEIPLSFHMTFQKNWPVLQKLREIYFATEEYFNRQFRLVQCKFPKLEAVRFGPYLGFFGVPEYFRDKGEEDDGPRCFPFTSDSKVESVTYLEIEWDWPSVWFEKFPGIFPNVQHLRLFNIQNLASFGHLIWKFKQLRRLTVELETAAQNFSANVDSVFTGFSPETTERLKDENISMGNEEIEELRVNDSVLDCDFLKEIHIKIGNHSFRDEAEYDLISPVSGKYGFKMSKCLENVHISVIPGESEFIPEAQTSYIREMKKLKASLVPMKPYATLTIHSK